MKKEIICGIYKITSPSGRVYIGESKDIYKRWKCYKKLKQTKSQPRLYHSILKYGHEEHIFEIIEECDFDDLKCRERHWQDFYDVLNGGLNCKLTNCGEVKQVYSQEMLERMSNSQKGKRLSKETCRKMGESRRGEKSPMARKVIDTITLTTWNCIEDAAKVMGFSKDRMAKYLRGDRPNRTTCVYLEDYIEGMVVIPVTEDRVQTIIDTKTKIQYETLLEASKACGVTHSVLSRYLTGKLPNKTTYMYLKDYSEDIGVKEPDSKKEVESSIKVIDVETKVVYNFITDAAKAVGLSKGTLGRYLSGQHPNKTNMMYLSDYIEGQGLINKPKKKPLIIDTATGITYKTTSLASEVCGVKRDTLNGYLKGDSPNKTTMQHYYPEE